MPKTVFISYSRWNKPFADRLKIDLERAGLTVWLDTTAILAGRAWRREIEQGIEAADDFVLLASPESWRSPIVQEELAYAQKCQKPVVPLLIGGTAEMMPADWANLQVIDFTRDEYWHSLPELFRNLSPTLHPPTGYTAYLGRSDCKVRDAAENLRGERKIRIAGGEFLGLPLGPTGYTTSWLIGPADEPIRIPDEIAWVLHFSGPVSRQVDQDVLGYLLGRGYPPWVVSVEGPKNLKQGYYDLAGSHVWVDAVEVSVRLFDRFLRGKFVRMFMNSPIQIGFAVGGRTKEMFRKYELYHYTASAGQSGHAYERVYEGGRT